MIIQLTCDLTAFCFQNLLLSAFMEPYMQDMINNLKSAGSLFVNMS